MIHRAWLGSTFCRQFFWLLCAVFFVVLTLASGFALLAVSGWFITATALASMSLSALLHFNYFTPAVIVRALSLIKIISRYLERIMGHEATFKLLTHFRVQFYQKLQKCSTLFLQRYYFAELLNGFIADIDTLDHFFLRFFTPFFASIILCSGVFCFFLLYLSQLSWIIVCLVVLFYAILAPIFYQAGKRYGQQIGKILEQLRCIIIEYLKGMGEWRIYATQAHWQDKIQNCEKKLIKKQKHMMQTNAVVSVVGSLAISCAVVMSIFLLDRPLRTQQISGAFAVAIVIFVLSLTEVFNGVVQAFQFLAFSRVSLQRLNKILNIHDMQFGTEELSVDKPKPLIFKQINFSYAQGKKIFDNFNLRVKAGEKIAILGSTGCGKSTLVHMLCRYLIPSSGSISLGGKSLATLSQSCLRRAFAVLPQRVHIFNDTLGFNLKLANEAVSDSCLLEVLTKLHLQHLAEEKSLLSLPLGAGGVTLSGGEVRRIGIARVLLSNAPIIILDEPTEGLDGFLEDKIMALIWEFCKNRTLICISHRLVGLLGMDRICLMEQGRIVEQGAHDELIRAGGDYATIISSRLVGT